MARTTRTKPNTLTRPLYATVGATDRAIELVRESVSDLQARLVELQRSINEVERDPQVLREQYVAAYDELVTRGDALVRRIRRQQATQDTVRSARTTSTKAKTTRTQADKAGRSTAASAQRATKTATTTAKRQAKAPRSSAKATVTSAGKTAKSAARATADATQKVGA